MNEGRIHRAVSDDGTEIAGRVQGQGPPLVLVHGGLGDGEFSFRFMLPFLVDHFTCFSMSTRGRGLSGDSADHSRARLSEDVAAFVKSVGEPVALFGHSSGAALAIGGAALAAEDVVALALYEPPLHEAGWGARFSGDDTWRRINAAVAEGRLGDAVQIMTSEIGLDHDEQALFALPAVAEFVHPLIAVALRDTREFYRPLDRGALEKLTMPVLLLQGARSGNHFKEAIRYLAERLDDAQVVEIAGTGHMGPVTAAEAVATVLLADATQVDVERKKVGFTDGEIGYDYLILATGATDSYFGHEDWALCAPGLKSIEDALEIRRRVLVAYEAAERTEDPERRSTWLQFVIVGAGPTGVELAGALAEISRRALARDFRNIDPTQARILLLEGLDRVLPTFPPQLSEKARRQLERLGVEVRVQKKVTRVDEEGVSLDDERIEAKTVLWTAGVAASPIAQSLGVPLDRAGRVQVMPDLTIPGRSDVFVIGELAAFEQDGHLVPGVAPAAIQEARHAAGNITRAVKGKLYFPFRYRDKGMLAVIGRAAAVANLRHLKLSGFIAWLTWVIVHLYLLIGFRNRIIVMFEWAWAYFTYERGARLITGRIDRLKD